MNTKKITSTNSRFELISPQFQIVSSISLVILLLVARFIPSLYPAILILFALHAMCGPKQTIQSFTLMVIFLLLNPEIFTNLALGASLRWLILFAALIRMLWDGVITKLPSPRLLLQSLLLYSSVVTILALIVSYSPQLSVLKIVSFTVGASVILVSFHRTVHLKEYWISWFATIFVTIIVTSILLFITAPGEVFTGDGFKGIMNQAQVYGPVAAPITCYLTGLVLFGKSDRSFFTVFGVIVGWISVYASLARTALAMVVGGLIVCMLVISANRGSASIKIFIPPVTSLIIIILIAGIIMTLYGESIGDSLRDFVLKENGVGESASFNVRRSMIDEQLANFKTSPLAGIGFGMASDRIKFANSPLTQTGPLGILTGAPTEKSFLPTAVLEETGIIGGILWVLLIFALLRPAIIRRDLPILWMFMAALFVNIGEANFFAIGGMGLYFWLIIGLSTSISSSVENIRLPDVPIDSQRAIRVS